MAHLNKSIIFIFEMFSIWPVLFKFHDCIEEPIGRAVSKLPTVTENL